MAEEGELGLKAGEVAGEGVGGFAASVSAGSSGLFEENNAGVWLEAGRRMAARAVAVRARSSRMVARSPMVCAMNSVGIGLPDEVMSRYLSWKM